MKKWGISPRVCLQTNNFWSSDMLPSWILIDYVRKSIVAYYRSRFLFLQTPNIGVFKIQVLTEWFSSFSDKIIGNSFKQLLSIDGVWCAKIFFYLNCGFSFLWWNFLRIFWNPPRILNIMIDFCCSPLYKVHQKFFIPGPKCNKFSQGLQQNMPVLAGVH